MVPGRHADVGQDRARAESPDRIEQLTSIADASQYLDLTGVFKEPAYALPDQVIVFCDDDPQPLRHQRLVAPAGVRHGCSYQHPADSRWSTARATRPRDRGCWQALRSARRWAGILDRYPPRPGTAG